jgi:hypothetical protein
MNRKIADIIENIEVIAFNVLNNKPAVINIITPIVQTASATKKILRRLFIVNNHLMMQQIFFLYIIF